MVVFKFIAVFLKILFFSASSQELSKINVSTLDFF